MFFEKHPSFPHNHFPDNQFLFSPLIYTIGVCFGVCFVRFCCWLLHPQICAFSSISFILCIFSQRWDQPFWFSTRWKKKSAFGIPEGVLSWSPVFKDVHGSLLAAPLDGVCWEMPGGVVDCGSGGWREKPAPTWRVRRPCSHPRPTQFHRCFQNSF